MKRGLGIFVVLMAMAIGSLAQDATPRVDHRQHNQRARIRQGWAKGDLTRREVGRLMAEQRHVRRAEYLAKADGNVTRMERMRLHRAQQRAHCDIIRQRRDSQSRMY